MPAALIARTVLRAQAALRTRAVRTLATAASPPPPKKAWLLTYKYVPDILERRGPHRDAHLAGARKQVEAGKLLIAGAYLDPTDGAAFIFTPKATRADVDAFVAADPYVKHGLVTSHSCRDWAVPVLHPDVDKLL